MTDDIVAQLREMCGNELWGEAADEIERLRYSRDAYRNRYHRALAASVWKPGTKWRTYKNPQRNDGLFVATVGDLVRPYQAVPDGCLGLQCQLPHDEAEAVVRILNEWTFWKEDPCGQD